MASLNGASGNAAVAVDVMGGDFAPGEVLKGAVEAHRSGVSVLLVGDSTVIRNGLDQLGADVPMAHASESIAMDEPVHQSLRREDSSLKRATELVAAGDAQAVVSCGNSAAIMGIAYRFWERLPGISRLAFGGFLPSHNGGVFVLDIGANASVKSSHLLQFAIMGDVYVRLTTGIEDPRIALLSNGTEDSKGTKSVKEANEALRKLDLNFIGNVEGNHVFEGRSDVVVCDGFSGNILLKGAEGVAVEIFNLLRDELTRDLFARVAAAAMMPAFTRVKARVDYQEYGGVPVLGVNHVMINCHGRSKAKAVTNAILLAERLAEEHLPARIGEALQQDDLEVGSRRRLVRALHLRHG
ncbi:MAG: phosphate acyltransferase PlsX [Chloroflexota bacterium]